jgi:hypothetical protein
VAQNEHDTVSRMRTIIMIAAACGCSGAAGPRTATPPAATAVTAADVTKIFLDPTAAPGWEQFEKRSDLLQFQLNTKDASGQFSIQPWDPAWPREGADFEIKLATPAFLNEGFRFSVQIRSLSSQEWLFRGFLVDLKDAAAQPAFVMVRTLGDKRFLCQGWSQHDEVAEVDASIAGCRSARL